jgi:uncharacterized repeat protein (TIGR01451 family)
MSSRSALVLCLVLSLSVIPAVQLATAQASNQYSERLDVYTAGSSAFWLATFSGANVTVPKTVGAVESISGVNSYSLTALQTTSAVPSSQFFWPDIYGVLKVPFVPDQGAFLTVSANSAGDAASAVTSFDAYLGASFSQVSSSGNSYTYFSPSSFAISGPALYERVPSQMRGLASLFNETGFVNLQMPVITLSGERSGGSFVHSVSIGSTATTGVSSGGVNLPALFNQTSASITSSPSSNSTQVVVHALDGLVQTSDHAVVLNHPANFSGSYSVTIPPNRKFSLNLTIIQDTPVLDAYRTLTQGSVASGDFVSVTVVVKNVAQTSTAVAQNVAVNDSWWKAYPNLFQLTSGNASFTIPTVAAGQNTSRVYVLKVISSQSEDLTVPAAPVTYTYTAQGQTLHRSTTLNEVEVRTNEQGPALSVQAGMDIPSGTAVGRAGHFLITVTNDGNSPALNLNVANSTQQNLGTGAVWKVNESLPPPSLVNRNFTRTFTLTWTAPDGSKGTLASNPDGAIFTNSGASLPFLQFTMSPIVVSGGLASGKVNMTYSLSNAGSANATAVTLSQPLPTGMTCKAVTTGSATCGASSVTLNIPSIPPHGNSSGLFSVSFSNDNYVIPPASISTTFGGETFHTAGTSIIVPAGVSATKTFTINPVFQGMQDVADIKVTNTGTAPIFNVTATSTADVFTAIPSTQPTQKTFPRIDPQGSQSFNYSSSISESGNHTIGSVTLKFIVAGFAEQYGLEQGTMTIYPPLSASAQTTPAIPTEGHDFVLKISLTNPAPVAVANVVLTVPIPASDKVVSALGMQAQGHSLVLTLGTMAARSNTTQSITLLSGTDVTSPFVNSTLTFQYQGATIKGVIALPTVSVGVDVLTRYDIPIALAVVIMVAAAAYIHRKSEAAPGPGAK